MAIKILVPWQGLLPGDTVERGEALERKLIEQGFAVKAVLDSPPKIERATISPKETRNGKP